MRKTTLVFIFAFAVILSGCIPSSEDGDPAATGLNYYYDEFPDVAIPNEMKAQKKETFITYSADGTKLGTQIVAGSVDMASLVTAMKGHMARDGWTLRSVFRSSRSILIFERPDRICSIYITDGMMDTTMLIFVSPKLADGAAMQYSVPASRSTEPLGPSDPPISSSGGSSYSDPNVTVYPVQ